MPDIRTIKSVLTEYGIGWALNRALYGAKLKLLCVLPFTEQWYEKRMEYPKRLDLFCVDASGLRRFLRNLSDEKKACLIAAADRAEKGIITGFSSVELNYGFPIDWQLNPLTGKRCDETRKWFRIPDFDPERGDIKVVWEASRFTHFIVLSRAFLLTGEKRYYRAFSEQLADWLKRNPYGYGANFKCGQECSLRMVNALLAYSVFYACGLTSDADASNMRDLIDRCYRKVLGNFFYAYRCIKNNHTVSELMGMIVGAWCCGDRKQLDKAFFMLDRVVDEQFTKDGGYRQFSFIYQRFALQDLECILSIGKRIGKELSVKSLEMIRNAAMLMYQCQDESGEMPNYGNNDGTLAFPVTSCGYRDFRPVINTVYALCTGRQLYKDGLHQEELIWFGAGRSIETFEIQDVERTSKQFPDAGLFTIRGKRSWAMIICNDYKSRPAHMDQLHLDLWIDGINVLCDAGTYSYADELGKKLVRNESHNTALVDGVTQMNAKGPFLICDWTKRESVSYQAQTFEGTIYSPNGYHHTRQVHMTDEEYEITDRIDRDCTVLYRTSCEVKVEGDRAVLSYHGKDICEIISNAEIKQTSAVLSRFYYKSEPAVCLVLRGLAGVDIDVKIKRIEGEHQW